MIRIGRAVLRRGEVGVLHGRRGQGGWHAVGKGGINTLQFIDQNALRLPLLIGRVERCEIKQGDFDGGLSTVQFSLGCTGQAETDADKREQT